MNKMIIGIVSKHTPSNNIRTDTFIRDEVGYPDVIEAKNKKFYIGVRFHPESLYKKDENMNNIFKYFINTCKY